MKKLVSVSLSVALLFSPVQQTFAAGGDPLFAENTCSGQGCWDQFYQLIGLTVVQGAISWGLMAEAHNKGFSSVLMKEVGFARSAILEAEKAVATATAQIIEEERATLINNLRTELSRLRQAADIGDRVTVNVSSSELAEASVTQEIRRLELVNESLRSQLHITADTEIKASIETALRENTEKIATFRQSTMIRFQSASSSTAQVVDVYAKDLQPAIAELEGRLSRAQALPIISTQQRAANVQIAQLSLASKKEEFGKYISKQAAARSLRVVAGLGGILMIVDGSSRVLLYAGGKDPFMSPVVTLGVAPIKAFNRLIGN